MKLAVLSALVASCAAFAPSAEKASTTALSASKYADALGAQAPVSASGLPVQYTGSFLTV